MRISIVAMALVALVGCGGGSSMPKASSSTGSRPTSTAMLTIIEPKAGQAFDSDNIALKLSLTGARIVPRATTALTPDTGHIHVSVNGKLLTLYAGLSYQIPKDAIRKGTNLVQAEFVAADHGFFNPRVVATVTFTRR